jgi:tRNA threonylcarbamoyladenosine biosynthesis protein TsaE
MTGSKYTMVCNEERELPEVAGALLAHYPGCRFFAFYGEMGAGKTTLIKAICETLGVTDTVCSPSFAIVNIYQTKKRGEICHFDLYRLNSMEELYDIGYEDYFYSNSWCLVEWAEKIESLLPEFTVRVTIEVSLSDGSRVFRF